MLNFRRTFAGDVLINETTIVLENCHLYELFTKERRAGRFYSGDNYSFAEFNDEKIRIESKRNFFRRSEHKIINQYNRELIGYYELGTTLNFNHEIKATLFLANGFNYQFSEVLEHRKIMEPETWSLYRFDLHSEKHAISYYGRMRPNNFRQPPLQTFEGEIQSTEDIFLLPVFAGIFIIEEKFRLMKQFEE